jgi:methyl-accepting chemotaxis protein
MGRTPIDKSFVLWHGLAIALGLSAGGCSRQTIESHMDDFRTARERARENVGLAAESARDRTEAVKARLPEFRESMHETLERAKERAEVLKEKLPTEEEWREKYERVREGAERIREELPSREEVSAKAVETGATLREATRTARESAQERVRETREALRDKL